MPCVSVPFEYHFLAVRCQLIVLVPPSTPLLPYFLRGIKKKTYPIMIASVGIISSVYTAKVGTEYAPKTLHGSACSRINEGVQYDERDSRVSGIIQRWILLFCWQSFNVHFPTIPKQFIGNIPPTVSSYRRKVSCYQFCDTEIHNDTASPVPRICSACEVHLEYKTAFCSHLKKVRGKKEKQQRRQRVECNFSCSRSGRKNKSLTT